ncbi:hypothetical protein CKO_03123 [Citrobacter koseri ATCC BAA-895]|uniref:Uncharacterized protein n=1 Tax=Citrobacter koseri (strain ATCC BAA-895 / CDC 4225-83 / SGSC4696) TaxID=290338 RepID=A8AL51_CITK8|nr:hypothetical protein CKO_03123 [Citrobacter koseri ATCC BAA-895]
MKDQKKDSMSAIFAFTSRFPELQPRQHSPFLFAKNQVTTLYIHTDKGSKISNKGGLPPLSYSSSLPPSS